MKILENIRTWKNKVFPDWLWDILVGGLLGCLGLFGLLIQANWLVLAIPFIVTVINQFYNRLFELKDGLLRMIIPTILYILL